MLFSNKKWVVWPLIIDQRLVHITTHMFPCPWSHSWIIGGDHSFVKNLYVLSFDVVENCRSWLLSTKMGLCGHWPSTRGSYSSPYICFLVMDHILGFLLETISRSKIRRCQPSVLLKMVVHAIFDKMGVVWPLIINQMPIHLTPHMFSCHRSHSWISGGDHFLVKNPYMLAFRIIENVCSCYFWQK
jgi:hypothetical protein